MPSVEIEIYNYFRVWHPKVSVALLLSRVGIRYSIIHNNLCCFIYTSNRHTWGSPCTTPFAMMMMTMSFANCTRFVLCTHRNWISVIYCYVRNTVRYGADYSLYLQINGTRMRFHLVLEYHKRQCVTARTECENIGQWINGLIVSAQWIVKTEIVETHDNTNVLTIWMANFYFR